ncbi:MAG: TRAP transporter small permease subunit [Deltaproteobacteria bacterium]|nr:TRAP transporter small permease subunit [Deltaproteobacteria bacterium]
MNGESMESPAICKKLDRFVIKVGKAAAWSNCLLVLAIILNVVLRYVFGKGQVWLEEMQWHLYGLAVMIGLSYSQAVDSPIRVDILHQRFSRKSKAAWEIVGTLLFLLPWVVVLIWMGVDFWTESWRVNESSDSPLGLPFRWIIKAVIPISFTLLGVTAISRFISSIAVLVAPRGNRHAG